MGRPKQQIANTNYTQDEESMENHPLITSPEWNDFIMSEFSQEEKDKSGYPKLDGIRRLFKRYVGEIVKFGPTFVQPPGPSNGGVAVVIFQILAHCKQTSQVLDFSDVADAHVYNVTKAPFSGFLTAIASTRAECRALRKGLNMKTPASEELDNDAKPLSFANQSSESSGPAKIKQVQVMTIKNICKELGIDVEKMLEVAKLGDELESIAYEKALKVISKLHDWQKDSALIPAKIKA